MPFLFILDTCDTEQPLTKLTEAKEMKVYGK